MDGVCQTYEVFVVLSVLVVGLEVPQPALRVVPGDLHPDVPLVVPHVVVRPHPAPVFYLNLHTVVKEKNEVTVYLNICRGELIFLK